MISGFIIALVTQVGPPWMGTHWLPPAGHEAAEYQCEAGEVRLRIDRPPSTDGRFQLSEWSIGGEGISPQRLAAWNERLTELTFYQGYGVVCRGDWVGIDIDGYRFDPATGASNPTKVSVMFGRGGAWFTDADGLVEAF